MKKINQYIVIIIFIGIIFTFGATNIIKFNQTLKSQSISMKNLSTENIEETYRTSFFKRDKLIDIYGLVQKTFQKNVIGNFEFIKDTNGFMHKFSQPEDMTGFCSDMQKLKSKLDVLNTPLLYVQDPARELKGSTTFVGNIKVDGNSGQDVILSSLKVNNIDNIDMRKKITEQKYDPQNVYLRTDIHMTTEAELWVLKNIVSELEKKYRLQFENNKQVLNMNSYTVISKDFLGNLGRSSGSFFTGLDRFNMYIPKFDTSMKLTNPTSNIVKNGTFEDVVLNGNEKQPGSNYLNYWVTNYMQFPSPYYEIQNNKVSKNNILIIMDSMGMRTASYLSLMVHSLTVIDTRFQGNTSYIDQMLAKRHYDAVIVLQGDSTTLVGSGLFPPVLQNPQAEIVSTNTPTNVERGKKYNVNIVVKNTGTESWSEKQAIRLCIFQDGKDWGYRVKLPDGVEIKQGQEYTFVLQNFQAPSSNSTYLEYQMAEEGVVYFGQKKRVNITAK